MHLSSSGPGRATARGFAKLTASPFWDTTPPPPASPALEKGMSEDTVTTWSPSGPGRRSVLGFLKKFIKTAWSGSTCVYSKCSESGDKWVTTL